MDVEISGQDDRSSKQAELNAEDEHLGDAVMSTVGTVAAARPSCRDVPLAAVADADDEEEDETVGHGLTKKTPIYNYREDRNNVVQFDGNYWSTTGARHQHVHGYSTDISAVDCSQSFETQSGVITSSPSRPISINSAAAESLPTIDNLSTFSYQMPDITNSKVHGNAAPGLAPSVSSLSNRTNLMSELQAIYQGIQRCLDLRDKYISRSLQKPGDNPKDDSETWKIYPTTEAGDVNNRKPTEHVSAKCCFEDCHISKEYYGTYALDDSGVYQVYDSEKSEKENKPLVQVPTLREYFRDLDELLSILSDGPSKSFAFRRLLYLETKWSMYILLNEFQEITDSKRVPHRDFYNIRKVDTHVHHSSCMSQKHLLRFIKTKLKQEPDEVVIYRDDRLLKLSEVFDSLNLTAYDLSINTLDMHAHNDSFHRFDKFNLKYNPIGESRLRTIFLKTDNHIKGRYMAELTREVFSDLETSKYQMAEYRVSIYGRSVDEWDKLAAWVIDNNLFSTNVRWFIQVPRLYHVYKKSDIVNTFEDCLKNIFQPLFEVSQCPASHPKLDVFLHRVIGFDSVDDESKAEQRLFRKFPTPRDWGYSQNPPYSYYLYYMYANMTSLNALRARRGFNTFALWPHSGEAGDTDHLASAFLTSQGISHGILLRKVPMLQYLWYLEQIPICMSPLSNNALFIAYDRNPFYNYFRRGINVSLSTDDPLQFHFGSDPLIEEYAVAAQIYKLSPVDMCELARNSILQSGFELALKKQWLGMNLNDIQMTNVPFIRLAFRQDTLEQEREMVKKYASQQLQSR